MRKISDAFKNYLTNNEDIRPLLEQIKTDSTLDCEIRENKLQIYYRGAELFSIEEKGGKYYFTKSGNSIIKEKNEEICKEAIRDMVDITIPKRKNLLDLYGQNGPEGCERESQQLIVRENNLNLKAEETDYYIVDIENVDSYLGLRFDLLAVKTKHDGKDRTTPPKKLAIMELKYSDDSVDSGESSLENHFIDLSNFLTDETKYFELKAQIRYLFNLKCELGIINKPDVKNDFVIKENDLAEKLEYIIIFANYNVNDLKQNQNLYNLLIKIRNKYPLVFDKMDVRVATSAFMGYALYADYMIPYDDFVNSLLKKGLTNKEFIEQYTELQEKNTWHYGNEKKLFNKKDYEKIYNHGMNEISKDLPDEKWASLAHIKGYSKYSVSSFGRVKFNEIVLEQGDYNNSGYLKLDPRNLYPGKIDHEINVYTLIAMGFLGKTFNDGYDVHHKDNNGYDCRLENLVLLTRKQHIAIHSNIPKEDLKSFLSEE